MVPSALNTGPQEGDFFMSIINNGENQTTMEKSYDPKKVEAKIYHNWEKNGLFKPKTSKSQKPFVVVIPPPNITGSLHMGHALNNTIQDVLIRWHRMKGAPTLWVPGTDHAGIATQNKVEQKLKKEGTSRFKIGRESFNAEVWKWKDQYQERIFDQLKILGCSCDWTRTRFTMDYDYSISVIRAFVHYYEKKYLYRGLRIVNWCPRCSTSISDLEVEHQESKSFLWYIDYEIKGEPTGITVATTRPETMLGDTAIAVNPQDKRYKELIGKKAIIPIIKREIPIIADRIVDQEFGTGAVKVTPAHDPIDYEIGERHNLETITVIGKDGKMIKEAGLKFAGLDRFEARKQMLYLLKTENRLKKTKPYEHNIGHCYRCNAIIEPLLSEQWFVRMTELAKPAVMAVKNKKVAFHPSKWEKVYLNWMGGIKDWCISRQLWWGHQLPVWYCDCGEIVVSEKWAIEDLSNVPGLAKRPNKTKGDKETKRQCPKCKKSLKRDEDVLDTWFSSALWPFAVFSWPQKTDDLKQFYPTSVLSTARDIINLWVSRMIMSGLEFQKKVPFSDVYIHATVFNKEGKRMSKSLGTGVDPLDLIDKYGTDAIRFGLLWQVAQGQDMKFGEEAILNGKRFANKVWNASRFALMNLEDYESVSRETFELEIKPYLSVTDRKTLQKLNQTIENMGKHLSNFDFQHAIEELYNFFWHEYCDKCIEDTKVRIKSQKKDKIAAQYTLRTTLEVSLKLLHPFMPFITEEIWKNLSKTPLITAPWPEKVYY